MFHKGWKTLAAMSMAVYPFKRMEMDDSFPPRYQPDREPGKTARKGLYSQSCTMHAS